MDRGHGMMSGMIDRARLAALMTIEQDRFLASHPRSATAYQSASHLFGRVPMTWMNKLAGGFPIYFEAGRGNRVRDIDGNEYLDSFIFCGCLQVIAGNHFTHTFYDCLVKSNIIYLEVFQVVTPFFQG